MLKQRKTLLFLPMILVTYHSYQTTSVPFPASEQTAKKAMGLEIMAWVSLIGGIALCVLILTYVSGGRGDGLALLSLVGSVVGMVVFSCLKVRLLRPVQITPAHSDYTQVRFQSEDYAREFAELNRLHVFKD